MMTLYHHDDGQSHIKVKRKRRRKRGRDGGRERDRKRRTGVRIFINRL